MGASITYCMVHLQAVASHLPDIWMMVYGTGRWAHFNVKLHFFLLINESISDCGMCTEGQMSRGPRSIGSSKGSKVSSCFI